MRVRDFHQDFKLALELSELVFSLSRYLKQNLDGNAAF